MEGPPSLPGLLQVPRRLPCCGQASLPLGLSWAARPSKATRARSPLSPVQPVVEFLAHLLEGKWFLWLLSLPSRFHVQLSKSHFLSPCSQPSLCRIHGFYTLPTRNRKHKKLGFRMTEPSWASLGQKGRQRAQSWSKWFGRQGQACVSR